MAAHFTPGSITLIPPGVWHMKTAEDSFSSIYIRFSSTVLSELGCRMLADDEAGTVTSLMTAIVHYTALPDGATVAQTLADAVERLLWRMAQKEKEDLDPEVEHIRRKIRENFTDPEFSIGKIISGEGYCVDHMRRKFIAATGETPVAYLCRMRLDYAEKMLLDDRDPPMTVAEAAYSSGFYEAGYFSRLFRARHGISPSQWRRNQNGKPT